MLKKDREKYFRKSAAVIDRSLKEFRETGDPEELHKLRVEIKKIKAMLLLAQHSFNEKMLPEEFQPLKKIFKKAGKIRDADVNAGLLAEHHVKDRKIKAALKKTLKEKGKNFIKKTGDYREIAEKQEKILLESLAGLADEKIRQLFHKELRLLSDKSHSRLGTLQLHECRKKIKSLLYAFETLPRITAQKIRLNKFYLKKLEETIGAWHDVVIVIELLREEKYKPGEIPKKLLAEKKKSREKVHELFADFQRNILLA